MKKILFVRIWPHPPIAASVSQLLQDAFPEFSLETIDIVPWLKRRPDILLVNSLYTVLEYFGAILSKKISPKVAFFGTTYFFKRIRRYLLDVYLPRMDEFAFSFQLQSLIDASIPGLPHFVYTDHTVLANRQYPGFDPSSVYHKDWIELERDIYVHATRVFTRSSNITQSIIQDYNCPPEKISCVYVGSNISDYLSSNDSTRYARKKILFVGIDWERKGGPTLVEAFKKVLINHPDAHLTIIGASPQVDCLNCSVLGYVPPYQLPRYYREASIFCMPTQLEPFGVVFVEALAYQLPIVTTEIGATSDFVIDGQNGYLVQPNQVDEVAEALENLLSDPERCQAFGQKSYAIQQEYYNWKAVGEKIRSNIMPTLKN